MPRLEGKVALVTGGGAGLGLAIAERLSGEGAAVAISDIDAGAEEVATAKGWLFIAHDVSCEEDWDRAMATLASELGPLGILVNNAGIVDTRTQDTPETLSLADWRRLFSVNVDGVFLGCQAGIKAMRETGRGSIINMSSIAGLRASPYAVGYGATKAAIRHLTRSVAQYCAEQGLAVRCNSVHPGSVRTRLFDDWLETQASARSMAVEQLAAEAADRVPMGALVEPEDVAAAVAYLASDESRLVTGTQMLVDGGMVECDSFHASEAYRARLGNPG